MSTARAAQPGPAQKHIYRLAMYGRPSSGKTCILAALAMMRVPHPEGFSCIWICDESSIPRPKGDPDTWNPDDPVVAAYQGKQWLREAIKRLEAGDLPPANPFNAAPFRFYFDFTLAEGRVLRVEMIDYTGELVNPDLSEDKFARRLRAHMAQADGVLILAEAPRPDDQYAPLYRELLRLQQAFMEIAESRRGKQTEHFPIALVLNKWDRLTQTPPATTSQAEAGVQRFLDSQPPVPQKVLANVLAAVAGQDAAGAPLARTFGLSAFGKARTILRETGQGQVKVDVPAQTNPLPSFGLEDPFVWLTQAADRLAEQDLQAEAAGLGPWRLRQFFTRKSLKVAAEADGFAARFPKNSARANLGKTLAGRARFIFLQQCLTAACFIFLLGFLTIQVGVYASDSSKLGRHFPAIKDDGQNDPGERLPQWQEAEKFLAGYATPAWYRWGSHLLLMSPRQANEHLTTLRPRINAVGVQEAFLAGFAQRLSNPATPEAELDRIVQQLEAFQPPADLPNVEKKKTELLAQATQLRDLRMIQGNQASLRDKYQEYVRAANFGAAADLIVQNCAKFPDLKAELTETYKKEAGLKLRDHVRILCKNEDWGKARAAIERAKGAAVDALLGAEYSGKLRKLEKHVEDEHANFAYAKWLTKKDNANYQNEVLTCANSLYKEETQKFINYLNEVNQRKNWTLSVEKVYYEWDGSRSGSNTIADLSVTANGVNITPRIQNPDGGRRKYYVDVYQALTLSNLKADDAFSLSIKMDSTNFIGGQETLGTANASFSIRQLAKKEPYAISLSIYRDGINKVSVRILEELPREPLPLDLRPLPLLDFP